MQSSEWHDLAKNMDEMELVVKKMVDFEAIWRTSERLTPGGYDSSNVSLSQQTFIELAARIKEGDLVKAA